MPDALDMNFLKAMRALRGGNRDEARALLEDNLTEDADHADSLEILGKILEEDGDLDRAIELTHRLREIRPDSIMAHANLSRFYMLKGDKETAEEWQARARVLGWKDEVTRKGMNPDEVTKPSADVDPAALVAQEAAVEKDPDSVVARLALAKSYRKLKMPVKAVAHLQEALARDETMSVLYLELAEALVDANRGAEALPLLEKGIPLAQKKGDLMPRNKMQVLLGKLKKGAAS